MEKFLRAENSSINRESSLNKKTAPDFAAEALVNITADSENIVENNLSAKEKDELLIETESISEVAQQLKALAGKIIESKKNYDLILSDDASGRLASLLLKYVLDEVQVKRGGSKPDIRFVAAGRHTNQKVFDGIKELLKKISPDRLLLVTEYIETGRGMDKLINILKELQIKFDLAAVSVNEEEGGLKRVSDRIADKPDQEFFIGEIGKKALSLYGNSLVSGVIKEPHKSDSPHPSRVRNRYRNLPDKGKDIQKDINRGRKDLHSLADEIISDSKDKI